VGRIQFEGESREINQEKQGIKGRFRNFQG
jgi:hypothetical protein